MSECFNVLLKIEDYTIKCIRNKRIYVIFQMINYLSYFSDFFFFKDSIHNIKFKFNIIEM